jgi:hypothetical protein
VVERILALLATALICGGCGLAPSSPEANDVGMRTRDGAVVLATRMCPGERLESIKASSRGAASDTADAWTRTYTAGKSGFVAVWLGQNSDGGISDLKLHGTIDVEYTTVFADGTHRTNGTFQVVRKIPKLPPGKWLADDGTIVKSDQLRAHGCSN